MIRRNKDLYRNPVTLQIRTWKEWKIDSNDWDIALTEDEYSLLKEEQMEISYKTRTVDQWEERVHRAKENKKWDILYELVHVVKDDETGQWIEN